MTFEGEPEYVQNISDRPLPEPLVWGKVTVDGVVIGEERDAFQLERRADLDAYHPKREQYPLDAEERARFEEYQQRRKNAAIIRFAAHELHFIPGQIYQVPPGCASVIVAMNPERLKKLTWREVRDLDKKTQAAVTEIQPQTVEEARILAFAVGSPKGEKPMPIISMDDGQTNWNPAV